MEEGGCGGLVVVDDTGAILTGLPFRLPARHLAPRRVLDEVRDRESREALQAMIELGRLAEAEPPGWARGEAVRAARRAGVERALSEADLDVLALAIAVARECGAERVAAATDDYALQAALARAGVRVVRIRYPGAREAFRRGRRGPPPP